MKNKLVILASTFLLLCVVSCSSDDNTIVTPTQTPSPDNSGTNYFPLLAGNYWTYDVLNQGNISRDSLYIANDTIISGSTYKKMKTLSQPTGFFSTSLRNNGIKIDGSNLIISGGLNFGAGLPTPINIAVSDFIFFKEGASTGQQLSSTTGTFTQTIQTYPLTFEYTLKSVSDGTLSSYISGGTTYTDITKTKVILNMKITTTQTIAGFPIVLTIMSPQDVIVSNQYYSKNIGMIYNNTLTSYTLNSVPGVTLPIPSSGTDTQEEFLKTYRVN